MAASEVADLFSLDRVLFVPTGQPWQKKNRSVTPAEDRYLMTTIATASNPRFSVSRVDIDRGGPTYTVDTLHDLHERYPNAELFFITGADAVARMATWRDCTEMMSLATFVAVTRPGYSLEKMELGPLGDSVTMVEVPAMAISSTNIRARARANRPIWYLVPDGVVQYIAKEKLYLPSGHSGTSSMW